MKYPKIETLYNRDKDTFKVIPSELRLPEFGLVKRWLVTEKVDGTNIRVMLDTDGNVTFEGRTDRAQIPAHLLRHLDDMFTQELMCSLFEPNELGYPEVTLFGEGYGEKIQKGGNYRKGVSFRLFDVRVGDWWLNWSSVQEIARNLGIKTVPYLGYIDFLPTCYAELEDVISLSVVAEEECGKLIRPEGIVCRTEPLLLMRNGQRLIFKLKFKDFREDD